MLGWFETQLPPTDVADYIARAAIGEMCWDGGCPRILDPACGSGVFLRAALDLVTLQRPQLNCLEFIEHSLYGIDLNPLAIEMACFVLLHECIRRDAGILEERMAAPWSLWHRIRCNLCVADALTFRLAPAEEGNANLAAKIRATLSKAYMPAASDGLQRQADSALFPQGIALGNAFPPLTRGADIIVGNPPYARIGLRADAASLERCFFRDHRHKAVPYDILMAESLGQ